MLHWMPYCLLLNNVYRIGDVFFRIDNITSSFFRIDNITAEVLQTEIRFATDWLHDLFHKIWNAVIIPEDWWRGLIV